MSMKKLNNNIAYNILLPVWMIKINSESLFQNCNNVHLLVAN